MAMRKQMEWMGFNINAYAKIAGSHFQGYYDENGEKKFNAVIELKTYTDESRKYQIDFQTIEFKAVAAASLNFDDFCKVTYNYLLRNQFLGWDSDEEGGLKYADILAEQSSQEVPIENN